MLHSEEAEIKLSYCKQALCLWHWVYFVEEYVICEIETLYCCYTAPPLICWSAVMDKSSCKSRLDIMSTTDSIVIVIDMKT